MKHADISFGRRNIAIIGIAFLLGVALTFMVFSFASASDEDIVAVVNGEAITKEAFYDEMERFAGESVLGDMILRTVVGQSEAARGVVIDEADIERELAVLKSHFPTEAAFEQALADEGLTMDTLIVDFRLNLILQSLSQEGVVVTDEEIKDYFEANKADLGEPFNVSVRHILVETEAEAQEIIDELGAGADFAALARSRSIDEGSAALGGEIGYVYADSAFVKPFLDASLQLDAGEISDPVQSMYGWHVIRADERNEARDAQLDEVADDIRAFLTEQKARPIDEILHELLEEADIDVRWARYKNALPW